MAADLAALRLAGDHVKPLALANQRTLPVLPLLSGLFPDGRLRRGSVVGLAGIGATSLAMALAAEATSRGSWVAVVGDTGMGLAAAAEAGVAIERLLVVDPPDLDGWATALAALVGAVDLIVVGNGRRSPAITRRLSSRLRERGSVVLAIGGSWSPGPDVGLAVIESQWHGIGNGHGILRSRRVVVRAEGRGAAARPRSVEILLPGPEGAPAPIEAGGGDVVAIHG